METLLNALRNADQICRRTNIHFEKAVALEQQSGMLAEKIKKAKKKWAWIGVGAWFAGGIISSAVPSIAGILNILSIAGGVILGIGGYRNEKTTLERQIGNCRKRAQEERAAAQEIFAENDTALSFLPDDYWYPLATAYLVKAIASGRVTTLGEALDRFDAQLHRWRVEEANAELLSQQQAQTAHLRSIRTSSKVNAAANVTNAIFNIASRF